MYKDIFFTISNGHQCWPGKYGITVLFIILIYALGLISCNSGSSDATSASRLVESKEINIILMVENSSYDNSLSELNVTAQFDAVNQPETLELTLYDLEGIALAGYTESARFQSGDIKVPETGLVALQLSVANLNRAENAELNLILSISGSDFFSNAASFDILEDVTLHQCRIGVFPKSAKTDFPALFAQQTLALAGNRVQTDLTLSPGPKTGSSFAAQVLDGANVTVIIPAGTELFDRDGEPFEPHGDVHVSVQFISADPNGLATGSNTPLYAFPGGLDIIGIDGDGPDGLTSSSEFSFISAGFIAIEIEDALGNKVGSFNGDGITLSFDVPKSTINPDTLQPIHMDDGTIPLWSYDESTAKWRYEGEAPIVSENADTFTITKNINHLSYYNLDWYGSDRCSLDIEVVDADQQPNNQNLRVSFVKSDGGWAYKPSGWGADVDNLQIQRVPAFSGVFDLLDSQGNSLLAAIEVDSIVTTVPDGQQGLELEDFCFGMSADDTKSFKATLAISNPPRINLAPTLVLACPTDSSYSAQIDSGWYYLQEGYSYISSGEISSTTLELNNLIEGAVYTLYYNGSGVWGQVEFEAQGSISELSISALNLCPTVTQTFNARFVCLDDDLSVLKQKPADDMRFWIYSDDYSQYINGNTDASGNLALDEVVDGYDYFAYGYSLQNNQYYYYGPFTFTAAEDSTAVMDMQLSSDDAFCTTDLPINYSQTTISASPMTAPADGTSKIVLQVQERDQYGNARTSGTGSLVLARVSGINATIDNIQSGSNGSYSADVYSTEAGSIEITGSIAGTAIDGNITITFTAAFDASQSTIVTDTTTAAANGSDIITATIVAKDFNGANFGKSAGTLSFNLPGGVSLASSTDNGDGSYTATFSATSAGSVTLTPIIGGETLANSVNVTFTATLPNASMSTVSVNQSVDSVGDTITLSITLKNADGSDFGQSGGALSLASSPAGAIFGSLTDNGDGTYSANIQSSASATYAITTTVGGIVLDTEPNVTFTQMDATNTTVAPTSLNIVAGNSDTVTVTLYQADNSAILHGGHSVSVASLYIDTLGIIPSPVIADNSNGTYTITASCDITIGAPDNVTVSVDGEDVGIFSIKCD